jgi:zinc D-Ala-D-Ala carboxypeptidase
MIKFEELLKSKTADARLIQNVPTHEQTRNLIDLLCVLNAVRAVYDLPLIITSGFRSAQLNAAVGGAKNSAHMHGLAADVIPVQKNLENFLRIRELFAKFAARMGYNSIVIVEKPQLNGLPTWLHLELSKVKPSQVFTIK